MTDIWGRKGGREEGEAPGPHGIDPPLRQEIRGWASLIGILHCYLAFSSFELKSASLSFLLFFPFSFFSIVSLTCLFFFFWFISLSPFLFSWDLAGRRPPKALRFFLLNHGLESKSPLSLSRGLRVISTPVLAQGIS